MDIPSASSVEKYRHKFFADAMLGTLARWLRILGFDTSYEKFIDDNELIECCTLEGRVALTRDRRLARHRKLERCLFISEIL